MRKDRTKYIEFNLIEQKPKTSVWGVVNISSKQIIGIIKWYPQWRKYCFFPEYQCVFSIGCMKDISDFISQLISKRLQDRKNNNAPSTH